jgi:Concanavalin A-like lectin/glucanases superfamily
MKPTIRKPLLLPFAAAITLLYQHPTHAATYPQTILADNPVAYYRFEETSGATAVDSSTNANNGFINYVTQTDGITTFPQLGEPGLDTNSFLFGTSDTGIQSDVDIPYIPAVNPTLSDGTNGAPFTAELWVEATTDAGTYEVPLASSDGYFGATPNSAGWNFYQTAGPGSTWSYSIRPNPGFVGSGPAVQVLQWAHLVLAYDGTNTYFYVNGTLARSDAVPQYLANNGSADMFVGYGPETGWGAFDGYIDEVAVYSYPLSAVQVLNHYQVGTNSIRLVPLPAFLAQPSSESVYSGTTASFSATVSGAGPISYQWLRGANPIPGATNSSYSFLCHYPADDQATFSLIATNSYGAATSSAATLTVLTNLNLVNDPFSITREVGSYAAFRVVANGALPITYQWTSSTNSGATYNPIPGATNDTLWVANVQLANDQTMYVANVTGPFGMSPSTPATLSVIPRSVIVPLSAYGHVVVADNPVAYWRLNETDSPTNAVDAVGSFDGTYSGATNDYVFGYPTDIASEPDSAIHITNSAFVTVPYALELNPVTGPWSYEFWLKPTSQDAVNFHTPISSEANPGFTATTLSGWNIYQHVAGYWTWNIFNGGPNGSFTSEFVDHPVFTGQWFHMVLTDDLTTFRWYANNRLVFTYSVAGNFVQNGINGDPSVAGGPLTIGVRSDGAFGGWDGGFHDVAVYNYPLSATQVANHFLNATQVGITQSGGNVVITWPVGTLQASTIVTGTYTNVPGATSPYTNAISGKSTFYRVQLP